MILSDQRMPGMRGDVFLARAREVQPDAVRILFTGYADLQAVINAVNAGQIYRYITKPWDPDELESLIRQAAEQFDLLAERRRLVAELQEANACLTRANGELAAAVQLKSAFLEVASHEFNTPITMVQGLSELLRLLNPDRDPEEREIVDHIAAGANQLARLVASTLKLLRVDDLRQTIRREPVDLPALIRGVAEGVMPFVRARGLRLRVEVDEGLGTFDLDVGKVRDALANLLTNAIKFTPDGGEIALEADRAAGDEAEVRVIDRGIGIAPKELEHLFEPFFTQFDPSRHSSGDFGFNKRGLGLGLSLARKFVELHGGRIEAQSAPGRGTRMTVRLPRRGFPAPGLRVESQEGARAESPPAPRPRRRRRRPGPPAVTRPTPAAWNPSEGLRAMPTALIVEDEPEANKLLSMVVRLRGYRTDSAFTGGEALEKADRGRPDVVLLDLMLPDINGFEVCQALKGRRATNPIPVIMVTARVAADNRLQSFRVGADDYVPKPYTPDQIFRALASADARRRAQADQADRGEIPLGTPAEAETLGAIARLRGLLLARTPWGEEDVRRLAAALADLERDAVAWAQRTGVGRVATALYQRHPDRVTLTVSNDDHWFSAAGPPRDHLAPLIPLFDEAADAPSGREVVLTKHFPPAGPD